MTLNSPLPLLTIAGSDSGGAAGLQADLKTWAALGAEGHSLYGMSAITAVTAQNSERVAAVHYLPPAFVAAQIDAVLSDYGAAGIRANALLPGGTATDMAGDAAQRDWAAGLHAMKRIAEPEEIARAALFLASDMASFVSGSALWADGGNAAVKL